MSVETFGIEKEFLRALLTDGASGKARLPEFQRSWVWPMENIRSLLASISLGYPVGTVMMLRTGGEVRFKQRPIEGAAANGQPAERLILDGQQRLTSLFQALMLTRPIKTQDARKRELEGWFYVDMEKALDSSGDREGAFLFIPHDRMTRNFRGEVVLDISTAEKEYAAGMFPMGQVFDPDDWLDGYVEHWEYDKDRQKLKRRFSQEVLKPFDKYQMPVIELAASTPRPAVCQVFEKVNTGGVTLTVFELQTATFAADEFDLRGDWERQRKKWSSHRYRVLGQVSNTDFLQTVTLLATWEAQKASRATGEEDVPRVGCRRTDILELPLDAYRKWASAAADGYLAAGKLLHEQHIFDTKFLPYGSQLIPLAAILAHLGVDAETVGAREKISQWLWCGVFGELYGGTTETRFARDVPEVIAWIEGDPETPRTVQEARFASDRLRTLRTRNSAAYKGLYALLLKNQAVDWRSGEHASVTTYFDQAMDIHHIFPRAWCEKLRIPKSAYNSMANKTPLTGRTNRIIGGQAPSVYLARLAKDANTTREAIDANLKSHCVDPALLRADDFAGFLENRKRALLRLIADAMGKPPEGKLNEKVEEPAETEDDLVDD